MEEKGMVKKKGIILAISIILVGVLIAGGTYAYLSTAANVTNGNYAGAVECFDIVYGIDNEDGTTNIEGTLFPTATSSGGLFGDVSLNVSSDCNVTGTGTLSLHVNTKYGLVGYASSYCANAATLESVSDYTEQTTCEDAGYTWVVGGSVLKYKVASDSGNILSVGNILYDDYLYTEDGSILGDADSDGDVDSDDVSMIMKYIADNSLTINLTAADVNEDGVIDILDNIAVTKYVAKNGSSLGATYDVEFDIPLYTGFLVDNTVRNYTIYIWMDGYLTTESHADIGFSGYINASVTQNE